MKKMMWLLVLALTACGKQGQPMSPAASTPATVSASAMPMVQEKDAMRVQGGAEASLTQMTEPKVTSDVPGKYIAMRHQLNVETTADVMQESFDAAVRHCQTLNCQILSANFNKETPYSPPSANLSARIPPRNVSVFLDRLAQHGEILSHSQDSEDMTNQVVDTEARIKNLTDFRDQLRVMMTDKTAKFKDLIEVRRELTNTQSELDSVTSMRKLLSQQTDLVAVNISFSAKQGITEQGFFAPVARAIKEAGHVMMESVASLITLIAGAVPWLLIGLPIIFLIRKYWTKIRAIVR